MIDGKCMQSSVPPIKGRSATVFSGIWIARGGGKQHKKSEEHRVVSAASQGLVEAQGGPGDY